MNFSSKKESGKYDVVKFDSTDLDNPCNKSLNFYVIDQSELRLFEKVITQDFSNLETFYNSIKEAKERAINEDSQSFENE